MLNDDNKNRDHGKIFWWGDRRYGLSDPMQATGTCSSTMPSARPDN